MTTSLDTTRVARFVRWVIDVDGHSYGDERERLRYYEAHSAMLTVQTYLLPVVAAGIILAFGKRSVAPVLIVTSVPLLTAFVGLAFLGRAEVSLRANTFAKPARTFAYFAAYACLPLAILVTLRSSVEWDAATLIGVVGGAAVALAATVALTHQQDRRESPEGDQ